MMNQDELVRIFVKESQVNLEAIDSNLHEMQRDIDNIDFDILDDVFRGLRSIKGASGFYHFHKIGALSHRMGNMISQLRHQMINVTFQHFEVLLSSVGLLKKMLDDIDNSEQYDIQNKLEELKMLSEQRDRPTCKITVQTGNDSSRKGIVFEIPEERLEYYITSGQSLYTLTFFADKDLTPKGKTPFDLINAINKYGEFIESSLNIDKIQGLADCLDDDLSFVVLFGTSMERALIPGALDISKDQISVVDLEALRQKHGIENSGDLNAQRDTLYLEPKTDLVASQIERLRDSFLAKLKAYPNVSKVILKADNIEIVDSLGVNLIIGIYRQVHADAKTFEITGAGEKFLKVANFFQFYSLFNIHLKE